MTADAHPLTFFKLEGLGNDFVLVDARDNPVSYSADDVRRLADRHTGIGFDQLLVLVPAGPAGTGIRIDIHNADGSPAEQCGNGMRAIAAWLDARGQLGDGVEVETPAGPVGLERAPPIDRRPAWTATLPGPTFPDMPDDIDEPGAVHVDTGNPHLVVTWPRVPDAADLEQLAERRFRHGDRDRFNIGLAHARDPHTIALRVHERGSGPTRACGSGACAAAAALIRDGHAVTPVLVEQPGGNVVVNWTLGASRIELTGAARVVYQGTIEWPNPN